MSTGIQIVYDGDCPFCAQYIRMTHLKNAVGNVELIDARSDHPLVNEIKAKGIDLNDGMLARYGGQDYFGSDCMNLLALLSNHESFMDRTISWVFAREPIARRLYPFLRAGRSLTLKMLGRSRIS